MRKIVFTYHTGYCGMDGHDFRVYPDDVTDDELHDDAWEGALSNAESFGIYPYPEEFGDDDEDDETDYSYDIEGSWEEYDPDKHDGFSTSSFSVAKFFEKANLETD